MSIVVEMDMIQGHAYSHWRGLNNIKNGNKIKEKIKEVFERLNENIDYIMYFVNKTSLKSSKFGIVKLKFLESSNFLLHDVLYIPNLKSNLLYVVHI